MELAADGGVGGVGVGPFGIGGELEPHAALVFSGPQKRNSAPQKRFLGPQWGMRRGIGGEEIVD